MRLVYRPLTAWTDPLPTVEVTPFTAGWPDTVDLLAREVGKLSRDRDPEVVVELDVPAGDFRVDGGLRAGYRAASAKVVVSFASMHGPMRLACAAFRLPRDGRESWQCNVRAIALALESLRRVQRYKIGRTNEQYTGFGQLGTGLGAISAKAKMSVEDAAMFLTRHGGGTIFDLLPPQRDAVMSAHRRAAQVLHPDHGGEPGMLQSATEARDVLLAVTID